MIYSDNAKTFVLASKWVQKINKDVEFKDFLASKKIKWKFKIFKSNNDISTNVNKQHRNDGLMIISKH